MRPVALTAKPSSHSRGVSIPLALLIPIHLTCHSASSLSPHAPPTHVHLLCKALLELLQAGWAANDAYAWEVRHCMWYVRVGCYEPPASSLPRCRHRHHRRIPRACGCRGCGEGGPQHDRGNGRADAAARLQQLTVVQHHCEPGGVVAKAWQGMSHPSDPPAGCTWRRRAQTENKAASLAGSVLQFSGAGRKGRWAAGR